MQNTCLISQQWFLHVLKCESRRVCCVFSSAAQSVCSCEMWLSSPESSFKREREERELFDGEKKWDKRNLGYTGVGLNSTGGWGGFFLGDSWYNWLQKQCLKPFVETCCPAKSKVCDLQWTYCSFTQVIRTHESAHVYSEAASLGMCVTLIHHQSITSLNGDHNKAFV